MEEAVEVGEVLGETGFEGGGKEGGHLTGARRGKGISSP
jgi:hypothetical protein